MSVTPASSTSLSSRPAADSDTVGAPIWTVPNPKTETRKPVLPNRRYFTVSLREEIEQHLVEPLRPGGFVVQGAEILEVVIISSRREAAMVKLADELARDSDGGVELRERVALLRAHVEPDPQLADRV